MCQNEVGGIAPKCFFIHNTLITEKFRVETAGEKFTIDMTLTSGICFYKKLQVFV